PALAASGRLAPACAADLGAALDVLGQSLAALRAGQPATTTTVSASSTTSGTTAVSTTVTTTTATSTTTTTILPTCGNGQLDRGEQCDGTNLFGRDCRTLGFGGGGELACRPDCIFDTSGCRR